MRRAGTISLSIIVMSLYGCLSSHQSIGTDTSAISWNGKNAAVLYFENNDTVSLRNMHILLRHDGKTDDDSVKLRLSVLSPDRQSECDTVVVYLKHKFTSNDIQETASAIFSDIRLGKTGRYEFAIMPLSEISGIWGVGLDFEKK